MKRVHIRTYSAVTVLNAIPAWRGAALGIDIPVDIVISESDTLHVEAADTRFLTYLLRRFEQYFNVSLDKVRIVVRSQIPPRSGLKSSSSVSAGLIIALTKSLNIDITIHKCLELSATWSREYGVSITGALDDAAASVLGGLVLTDNRECRIEVSEDIPEEFKRCHVLTVIFRGWQKPDTDTIRRALSMLEPVYVKLYMMLKNDLSALRDVMYVNGMLVATHLRYNTSKIVDIQERYQPYLVTLSGNGPTIVIVDSNFRKLEQIQSDLKEELEFTLITKFRERVISPEELVHEYPEF